MVYCRGSDVDEDSAGIWSRAWLAFGGDSADGGYGDGVYGLSALLVAIDIVGHG